MNIVQQEQIFQTKKLALTKARAFRHYLAPLFFSLLTMLMLIVAIREFITKPEYNISPYSLILLIFPLMALLLFVGQKKALNLKEIATGLSKQDNHLLVKETLKELKWSIKINNKGYVEAFIDNSGFFAQFVNQMFVIAITDGKILFTSIGNVDDAGSYSISWWKDLKNMDSFKKTFILLRAKHFS